MICDLCGHNNPQTNRFCGMCGMPLESAVFKPEQQAHESVRESVSSSSLGMEATDSSSVAAKPGWQPEPISSLWDRHPVTPSATKQTEPPSPWDRPPLSPASSRQPRGNPAVSAGTAGSILGVSDLPVRSPTTRISKPTTISGPSFLGLDREEAENPGYLLEDDQAGSRWLTYLAVLVVIVVGLLVALQWRSEVKARAGEIAAMLWARLHTPPPQTKVEEPSVSAAGHISEPGPSTPSAENASPLSAPDSASKAAQSQSSSNHSANAESKPPAQPSTDSPASAKSVPEGSDSKSKTTVVPSQREEPEAEQSEDNEEAAAPHRVAAIRSRKAEPRPATFAQDDSILLLAQKYLQGHGVPQDCGRGLSYLKEAVRKPSAQARSQMGALYATGTCVSQNRVEAYRWFTSALEIDPRNPWLARERDTLYGEMNRSERQQVSP